MPPHEGLSSETHPTAEEFWQATSPRDARARLVAALRLELLGPADPDEILSESPISRYTTGQLAPFGTQTPEDDHDEGGVGSGRTEESGAVDAEVPMSQTITIASIGLSFLVPRNIQQLTVKATWGTYAPVKIKTESTDGQSDSSAASGASGSSTSTGDRTTWVRTSCEPGPVTIQLRPGEGLQAGKRGKRLVANDDIFIEHLSKTSQTRGEFQTVSVFLVNRRRPTPGRGRRRPPANEWIFQPQVTVRSASKSAVFEPRPERSGARSEEPEDESNRLLFRNRFEFSIGHNCATTAEHADGERLAHTVQTELIPSYELPKVAPQQTSDVELDMAALGELESPEALQRALTPLLDHYDAWIAEKKQRARTDISNDLQSIADAHLDQCAAAHDRMRAGLDLLTADRDAFEAFRFANRAMGLQRTHTVWAHDRQSDPEHAGEAPTPQGKWRPFQLGFILLNLAGLIDPSHRDRDICDLLWFPTGGGKTEAYLGLTAFTIALRRRRKMRLRTDAGLSVLMRYTLRLLTLQQFQRASTLICACELLRREDPSWGSRRFSLGLWVGRKGTPNTHDRARQVLNKLRAHAGNSSHEDLPNYLSEANPCALEACPWCGEPLSPKDYRSDAAAVRTRVWCPRQGCAFDKQHCADGLPVLVIDEEIYLECPSMLIGTVDKFAQMPWNGNVRALFGRVTKECSQHGFLTPNTDHAMNHRTDHVVEDLEMPLAPPDLIIQDELHLIAGPLGTLVGLYENAVDFLCRRRDNGLIRPKLIASTATARRAHDQVKAVFQRELNIFPPAGLEPNDSFFAVEQPSSDAAPGRLYVGVCAPGKSLKTGYIRLAASLLSSAGGLAGHDKQLAEPYLTLVSYYNSIKDLGGHVRLMNDDIPARLQQLQFAGLPGRRRHLVYQELTSRKKQKEIPRLLREMEQRHDTYQEGATPRPLDAVLASNMISVGVDIDRFGLMAVNGQPKATAEYIQATSRVGRQRSGPGLVVTLYNWSRARDLSHYERFDYYHATLYRSVEAVSATPFSSRAQDRGLRAVYVAMARLGLDAWAPEQAANKFDPDDDLVEEIIKWLHKRARACPRLTAADAAALERDLKGFADRWAEWAESPLRYGWRNDRQVPRDTDVLLKTKEGGRLGKWPAPQSLREVEEQSVVRVLDAD